MNTRYALGIGPYKKSDLKDKNPCKIKVEQSVTTKYT